MPWRAVAIVVPLFLRRNSGELRDCQCSRTTEHRRGVRRCNVAIACPDIGWLFHRHALTAHFVPTGLSIPASLLVPQSRPPGPTGCTRSSTTVIARPCSPAMLSATPTDRRSRLWHERRGAADRYQRRQVGLPEFAAVFDPFAVPADLADQRLHSTSLLRIRFAVAPSGFRTIQKVVIVCWSSGSRPNR
jgi:hypothetical protein